MTPTVPILAAVCLAATLPEHSGPGTVVGALAFTDQLSPARPGSAFVWTITSDPSGGMFIITAAGVLVVANSTAVTGPGGGFNFYTGPASYTLGVSVADTLNSFQTGYAFSTVVVTVVEIDDAPVLAPANQIVQFFENFGTGAPLLGAVATPRITAIDENAWGSPFFSNTSFVAVPAASAVAVCGLPLAGARNATDSGSVAGNPLFALNASTGVVSMVRYVAAYNASWSSVHMLFQGAIVRAAFALCVNASDKPAASRGAWSAGYVYPVVVPDPSAGFAPANVTSIINGGALPADGGGACGGTPKTPTVVTLVGTGFGAAGTALASGTVITYGPTGVEFPCAVLRNNTNTTLQCTAGPGYGSGLTVVLAINGQVAVIGPGLTMAYAPPAVALVAPGAASTLPQCTVGSTGLDQLLTTGGQVGGAVYCVRNKQRGGSCSCCCCA